MKPTTTLVHDTAYVYDMFAISSIKCEFNSHDSKVLEAQTQLYYTLLDQQGFHDHYQITESEEYQDLYAVNKEMYVRINEMKTREPTGEDAKYIDDRVYQRFLAKKALQEKFFPSSPLTETKHGYTEQEDKRV